MRIDHGPGLVALYFALDAGFLLCVEDDLVEDTYSAILIHPAYDVSYRFLCMSKNMEVDETYEHMSLEQFRAYVEENLAEALLDCIEQIESNPSDYINVVD